jgi:hypothetical protein
MAISLKHKFVSSKSDGIDPTQVQPSNWNDQHDLTLASKHILGRYSSGAGAVEEIPLSDYMRLCLNFDSEADFHDYFGIDEKADKVSGAVNGNFAALTSDGNLADSNYKPASFEPRGMVHGRSLKTAAYTLAASDMGTVIEFSTASDVTLTIPNNSSVEIPVDSYVIVHRLGSGNLTFAGASGVALRSRGGFLRFAGQYSTAMAFKRGTNEWILSGDLVA